jgi:hypothetical protein
MTVQLHEFSYKTDRLRQNIHLDSISKFSFYLKQNTHVCLRYTGKCFSAV